MSKLRVWYVRNPPYNPTYFPVESVEDAKAKIDELARDDLAARDVVSNAMGLEEYDEEAGEWTEYYGEYGRGIDEIMRKAKNE